MNIFGLGPMELLLILVIALLIFGPRKLPEIAANLGKAIREFRKATSELTHEFTQELATPHHQKATQEDLSASPPQKAPEEIGGLQMDEDASSPKVLSN